MISKADRDIVTEGRGYPFNRNPKKSAVAKNDEERNTMHVVNLDDLQKPGSGPVTFTRQAGRTLDTFTKYWTDHDEDAEYDIR